MQADNTWSSESGDLGQDVPPFSVAHVTGNPKEGIVMASRNPRRDDEQAEAPAPDSIEEGQEVTGEDVAGVEKVLGEQPDGEEPKDELEGDGEGLGDLEKMLAEAAQEQPRPPVKERRPYVFTPFQGAKFVTDLLAKAGVTMDDGSPKIVNGPQMYIYARAGRFKLRRSPVDIQRVKEGKTTAKPRWEIFPLADFQAFAEEYVSNQKKGITAAQARKQRQESTAASDEAADQDLSAALEQSLARVGADGNGGEQTSEAE